MSPFFIALFKINLVLLLFAAAYYGILRRLTFYTANRAYLLFGIGFATLYPLIDLSTLFVQEDSAIAAVPQFTQQLKTMVTSDVAPTWLYIVFYTGLVVMLFRIARQLLALYGIHRRSDPAFIGESPVRLINAEMSPFSFGKHIYINPAAHNEEELLTIVAHENIHVRQRHTIDVLLAELSLTFYWFNPAAWIMRKAIKENLEFIADHQVLQQGADKKAYQYSLLHVGVLAGTPGIANDFNMVDLKKRIRMMNVRRSSRLTLSRYALLLPLLLLVTLIFTISLREPLQAAATALHLTPTPPAGEVTEASTATSTQSLTLSPAGSHTPAKRLQTQPQQNAMAAQDASQGPSSATREQITIELTSRKLVGQALPSGIQPRLYEPPASALTPGKPAFIGNREPVMMKSVQGVLLPQAAPQPEEIIVTGYQKVKKVVGFEVPPPADSSRRLREVTVIGRPRQ